MEIPTSLLVKYREFDRDAEQNIELPACMVLAGLYKRDLNKMTADIKQNGIKEPLTLLVKNGKALLVDGNHRLACALRANLSSMPIEVQFYDDLPEDGYKMYLSDKLEKMVDVDFSLFYALKYN